MPDLHDLHKYTLIPKASFSLSLIPGPSFALALPRPQTTLASFSVDEQWTRPNSSCLSYLKHPYPSSLPCFLPSLNCQPNQLLITEYHLLVS